MSLDLDELERLLAAATPSPWEVASETDDEDCHSDWSQSIWCPMDDFGARVCIVDDGRNPKENARRRRGNGVLIAALRNTVPELLARLRVAEALADKIVECRDADAQRDVGDAEAAQQLGELDGLLAAYRAARKP